MWCGSMEIFLTYHTLASPLRNLEQPPSWLPRWHVCQCWRRKDQQRIVVVGHRQESPPAGPCCSSLKRPCRCRRRLATMALMSAFDSGRPGRPCAARRGQSPRFRQSSAHAGVGRGYAVKGVAVLRLTCQVALANPSAHVDRREVAAYQMCMALKVAIGELHRWNQQGDAEVTADSRQLWPVVKTRASIGSWQFHAMASLVPFPCPPP